MPGLFGEVPILKKSGPYLVPISEKSGPYLVPFRDFFLVGPNLTTLIILNMCITDRLEIYPSMSDADVLPI